MISTNLQEICQKWKSDKHATAHLLIWTRDTFNSICNKLGNGSELLNQIDVDDKQFLASIFFLNKNIDYQLI